MRQVVYVYHKTMNTVWSRQGGFVSGLRGALAMLVYLWPWDGIVGDFQGLDSILGRGVVVCKHDVH